MITDWTVYAVRKNQSFIFNNWSHQTMYDYINFQSDESMSPKQPVCISASIHKRIQCKPPDVTGDRLQAGHHWTVTFRKGRLYYIYCSFVQRSGGSAWEMNRGVGWLRGSLLAIGTVYCLPIRSDIVYQLAHSSCPAWHNSFLLLELDWVCMYWRDVSIGIGDGEWEELQWESER